MTDTTTPERVDLFDATTPADKLLDDWLEQSLVEIGDQPEGQEQVDRLLWALRMLRGRRDEILAAAQARAQLVATWADAELEKLNPRMAYLEGVLEGWAHRDHEATGRKTWKLPAGELQVRARQLRAVATATVDAPLAVTVRSLLGDGAVTTATTHKLVINEVKAHTQCGEILDDPDVDVPEGYQAFQAVVGDDEAGYSVVPGVVLFQPRTGREGRTFTAVTK